MAIIGYARVSTGEQHTDGQVALLTAAGAERVFEDRGVSGTLRTRPALDEALAYLRPTDCLLVTRLDRLARSTRHTLDLLADLDARGVTFRSLADAGLDTTGPTGRLIVSVLAAVAQLESDLASSRTVAGLVAARARGGGQSGRPRAMNPAMIRVAREMIDAGETPGAVATALGVGRSTVYRSLERPAPSTER